MSEHPLNSVDYFLCLQAGRHVCHERLNRKANFKAKPKMVEVIPVEDKPEKQTIQIVPNIQLDDQLNDKVESVIKQLTDEREREKSQLQAIIDQEKKTLDQLEIMAQIKKKEGQIKKIEKKIVKEKKEEKINRLSKGLTSVVGGKKQ